MIRHIGLGAAAAVLAAGVAAAAPHPCAADAKEKAAGLLKLHMDGTDMDGSIGDTVTPKPPVKALRGKGKFEVLEVMGYVYKAQYRMRMIYAVMSDKSCLLMGQEIFEVADPY